MKEVSTENKVVHCLERFDYCINRSKNTDDSFTWFKLPRHVCESKGVAPNGKTCYYAIELRKWKSRYTKNSHVKVFKAPAFDITGGRNVN